MLETIVMLPIFLLSDWRRGNDINYLSTSLTARHYDY